MTKPVRLKRRVVYEGRIIRTEVDRVRLPNGRTVSMEVVRHRGSVVLLVQPSPETIVLIKQYRYVVGRWIWELPAGSREKGEALPACARRECEEETGFRPRRVKRLATMYPTPGFCDEFMAFFHCTDLQPARPDIERDVDEQLEPGVFPLAEVRRMIRQGRVIDMKTAVGLGLLGS